MDRVRDSRRGSCSSSSNSSAGFSFKRRPTCYSNEEDGQVGLRDRAARKERERERLRELLNRGRKKRRRITPGLSPSIVICGSVPRKPRSVGSRRKGNSWVFSYANVQPPSAPAPDKSSHFVQNEVEMEVAEVLFGLQKQESVTVQNCSVHSPQAEPLSINAASELSKDEPAIHNQDKVVSKLENSTVKEEVASMAVEPKSKRHEKFVIDLMKPPPVEFWPEELEVVRSSSNPLCSIKKEVVDEQPQPKMSVKAELRGFDQDHTKDELKLLFQKQKMKAWSNTTQIGSPLLPIELTGLSTGPLEGRHTKFRRENHMPFPMMKPPDFRLIQSKPKRCTTHCTIAQSIYKHQQTMHNCRGLLGSERTSRNRPQGLVPGRDLSYVRDRAQAIQVYLSTAQQGSSLRPASTVDNIHNHASHRIPMAGPFIFPFSQNQTVMARQSGASPCASSSASMRFSHPNGAPFFAVVPEFMGKQMQPSVGRENIRPLPKNFPFSTSPVDIRTSRSQRNVNDQSQSHSTNAGGPDLNFSLSRNPVCGQGFLDSSNPSSQILRVGHQMQHGNSDLFQNISRGELMQTERLSFARQNALSIRTHLSNSNRNQQQQMLHAMATSQLRLAPANAAKVSRDFAFFSGNLFDRSKSSHSLQQRASDIKQASQVFP